MLDFKGICRRIHILDKEQLLFLASDFCQIQNIQ